MENLLYMARPPFRGKLNSLYGDRSGFRGLMECDGECRLLTDRFIFALQFQRTGYIMYEE